MNEALEVVRRGGKADFVERVIKDPSFINTKADSKKYFVGLKHSSDPYKNKNHDGISHKKGNDIFF